MLYDGEISNCSFTKNAAEKGGLETYKHTHLKIHTRFFIINFLFLPFQLVVLPITP